MDLWSFSSKEQPGTVRIAGVMIESFVSQKITLRFTKVKQPPEAYN